jgi:hypothetical protein
VTTHEPFEVCVADSFGTRWTKRETFAATKKVEFARFSDSDTVEMTLKRPTHASGAGEVAQLLVKALKSSPQYEFRTRESLSRELMIDGAEFENALGELLEQGVVRRAVSRKPAHQDWYRLSERGMTRGEKWNFFLAGASRS